MIDWLTEPFRHTFMLHALLAVLMVGAIGGVAGVFVTLKGMAFMGDAIAHAIFPGIVIAYLLGGDYLVGALIAAIIISLLVGWISQSAKLNNDTVIGVLFAGAFALGIALISTRPSYSRDLTSFLIGSVLGVTKDDLRLTALIGLAVIGAILSFRREFVAVAFDPVYASATGLHVRRYDQAFLVLLSLAIVVSLQTVGTVLVLAMLVTPAATARLLTDRLPVLMALSAAIGCLSGAIGLYISYYQSIAAGASIVLVATAIFLLTYLFAPGAGIVTTTIQRRLHFPHPERDVFPSP